MNQHDPGNKMIPINPFTRVHTTGVAENRLGFPEPFYQAISPEKKMVLTVKDRHLVGYQTAIWKLLKENLTTLCPARRDRPGPVRQFLNYAAECWIIPPPEAPETLPPAIAGETRLLEVPPAMISLAQLTTAAVYVGLGYHFEIWSSANWQQVKDEVPYKSLGSSNLPDITA